MQLGISVTSQYQNYERMEIDRKKNIERENAENKNIENRNYTNIESQKQAK